jgi:hypothetical protein
MENKMVRVPFAVEIAKKITNGEVNGNIVTRDGRNVRIICFDAHCDDNIVALIEDEKGVEYLRGYVSDGMTFLTGECDCDLMLEIPEYMTFKDGDVIYAESIFGSDFIFLKKDDLHKTSKYVSLMHRIDLSFDNRHCCDDDNIKILRKATNEEIQAMINALRVSKHECAKECLKRFFGIEQKQEYEFKLFDIVLVRDDEEDDWRIAEYSHKTESNQYYVVGGLCWLRCIPYNEKTAHLLGTTDNWEE